MGPDNQDDILTPEELTALNETLQGSARAARSDEELRDEAERSTMVLRYDLIGARATHPYDMPALDLVQEQFALFLSRNLSRVTRQEGIFAPHRPRIVNFSEVYASLGMPCGVVPVEITGLGSNGLVLIEPKLLLHLIDLLIGGPGGETDTLELLASRGFTATERHLIRTLIEVIERALVTAWREVATVRLNVLRIEADPRHAAIFLPGDKVAEFAVDAEWGEIVGSIRVVIPVDALRPFEQRLARTTTTPSAVPDAVWRGALRNELQEVSAELTAILGHTEVSLREFLALDPGDVLRLDQNPSEPLEVRVEGVPKFHGHPAVVAGDMVVEIEKAEAEPPPMEDPTPAPTEMAPETEPEDVEGLPDLDEILETPTEAQT